MSFSSDVKAELCRIKNRKPCCAAAECYGILLYCNTFSANEIRIITSSPDFAELLPRLFGKTFGFGFDAALQRQEQGRKTFLINSPEKLRVIFDRYGIEPSMMLNHHINLAVLEEDCCKLAFLRGAFLAGGSVTDPEKHFHLELSTSHRSVSREAYSLFLELNFTPGEAVRKNNHLLYFKQANVIADVFTRLGAPGSSLKVQNAQVDREMTNMITRRVNCDNANLDKMVGASQEQIDAIHRYAARFGLETLPEALKATAYLRVANPESSLAELSQLSYPKVSKSCLSYRLKRIAELADGDGPAQKE